MDVSGIGNNNYFANFFDFMDKRSKENLSFSVMELVNLTGIMRRIPGYPMENISKTLMFPDSFLIMKLSEEISWIMPLK